MFYCVANNGRSVVDYMLASTSLFTSFTDFEVGSEDFSDHFPLYCKLSLTCPEHGNAQNSWQEMLNETSWNRFTWKESKKIEFLEHFHNLYSDFKGRILNRAESVTLFLEDFINAFKQTKLHTGFHHDMVFAIMFLKSRSDHNLFLTLRCA